MSTHERRNSVALDDAFNYCRWLETKSEPPQLYKLCNAIKTLDLALAGQENSPIPMSLCTDAWSRIRDSLFNILICSFAGHFEVIDIYGNPVDTASEWPEAGTVKFFPSRIARRHDGYEGRVERLSPSVVTVLRWCFAEHRQNVLPADFDNHEETAAPADENPSSQEARELLDRLWEVCEEEATEGKKKAHRKWWQLYWEANSCPNKRQRHQLEKQMVALEGIWGKPNA